MKLLGANDDMNGGRGPSAHRSQDDAAVGYVFQRHPHEADFPHFSHKQTPQPPPRWASGDETIIDSQDKWKYNGPMNSNPISAIGGGISMQQSQQQSHQVPPNTIGKPPSLPQMLNPSLHQQMQNQQDRSRQPTHQLPNHLSCGPNMNHSGMNSNSGMATMQMPPSMQSSSVGMYDHMQPSVNINGVNMSPKTDQQQNQMMQSQHLNAMQPQNQFLQSRNTSSINTSAAKKLWEKGGGVSDMKLTPLQLHGGPEQVWRDSTWSTQGEAILAPPRRYPHDSNPSAGILSPRDSTGGLGVKMVEYVLGGSPTNKESPLSNMESRLRGLKFDENDKTNDEKEKQNSPFDTNGLKKDEPVSNGGINGIDDDKGFNRTPGSRQPSPADETISRNPQMLLDPTTNNFHQQHFQHMLNTNTNMDMPYHPPLHHQMQGPVMNGGLQVPQNSQMVNQPQGHNSMDSSAALLQQQHNFDVQQLFRSQNPSLASNAGVAPPGQPTAQPQIPQTLPLPSQQYLAQQSAAYAAATQQPTPYVINPGQDATRYIEMGLIPAGMPQYYGVPWGMYPANLIPQQSSQPPQRRPLTPSQQAGENQPPYQMIQAYYDQSGSIVMGPRTGTPMRLVSPAPVLVPPGAQARAPQSMYPQPQTAQQNLYSQQNGSSVGGGLFAPQAFSSGLGTLGSPAQPSGLALNTSSLTARRDSFDRNTSAFSPSLDFNSSSVAAVAAANGNGTASRKWPVNNYGAMASVSPLAPGTPPPTGLGALVSNRAPGAETKYRNINQLAPVGLSTANTIFGSSNSLFSKIPGTVPVTVSAAPGVSATRSTTTTTLDRSSGRSRLLEDFRNQRYPNLQLRDLTNHIVEFSQDQHGSRFIQQKLERATAAEKQLVFNEILSSAYSLMTDVFGNYVIQKFFEFGTPEQKSTLAQQVKGHVLPLALQMYGCRVIQKALESIPSEQQQEIVRELDGHVLKCVKDQNGNHVVQKCIECVEPGALQFIIGAFSGQVYTLSTHPYGCRVIQRILEHCTTEQTAPILAELHAHTKNLIQDQYGNYVIQHVLEHGKPEDKSVLIASVRGKVLELSQHKFASNVVEKCVTHATRAERAFLIEEVCQFNDNVLHIMMKDQYANYVVQKMIDVSEPTQRKILMHKIRPHMNSLRKYTYGKHIIAKLEKFFMTKSNAIAPSATVAANSTGGASIGNAVASLNSSLTTNASNTSTSSVSTSVVVVGNSVSTEPTPMQSNLGPIGPPTSNGVL
ncbi:maternal protein pumilio-like isoform X2 [Sitodiplosis mosellana]|uniref:maternal protein pumilio-like isoform X2 n=1 Tax=Sitodiplosis mosellana TaxID=263140 RepID=UPI002444F3D3|nr:maternal protein pumilio-like isoform X2 [Sitodiplosis mosellana]